MLVITTNKITSQVCLINMNMHNRSFLDTGIKQIKAYTPLCHSHQIAVSVHLISINFFLSNKLS